MMDRRTFLCGLTLGTLSAPLAAEAQQAQNAFRVAQLAIAAPTDIPPPPPANWEGFVRGLREVGYVEGENLAFIHRSAKGQPELFPALAADLARLGPDVIFARGPEALRAAKNATRTIPIVAIDLETDPVVTGVVASWARPGGNVTGVFLDLAELTGKHVELLREIVPRLSRIGVLGEPVSNASQLRAVKAAAGTLAVQTRMLEFRGLKDLDRAFQSATGWRSEAVIVLSSPLTNLYRKEIADFAATRRLPAIYLYRVNVEAGGLMSYGPNLPDMFRRCGVYVGKILGGARPGDLPIERPTRFELVINLKAAKTLGVTIPPSVLLRADQAIE